MAKDANRCQELPRIAMGWWVKELYLGARKSLKWERIMIVVAKVMNGKNYRLCQDNLWREWAHFGTFPECVKEYVSRGWAEKAAKKKKGFVIELKKGEAMDAFGRVYPEN